MRRAPVIALELGLATALVATAGCSASSSHESQPSTSEIPSVASIAPTKPAATSTAPTVAPTTGTAPAEMKLAYEFAPGASKDLAKAQVPVGYMAVQSVLSAPFNVTINGKPRSVTVRIPAEVEARNQEVIFAANSNQAGSIFAGLKIDADANEDRSVTSYGVKRGANGELTQDGISVSVVGQETQGVGLFQNIATERCQALEIVSKPAITVTGLYAAIKEGICNSAGIAADSAVLHQSYGQYVERITSAGNLGSDVNHSYDIKYPVLSASQYAQLYTN